MENKREQARQDALAARENTAAKARVRQKKIEDTPFRKSIIDGIERYSKVFDSVTSMAKSVGVSQPTMAKVLSGNQDPGLGAVGKIMSSIGATVVFPWEPKDHTRKVVVAGGTQSLREVLLFEIVDNSVSMSDKTALIYPQAELEKLSPTLSLGAYILKDGERAPTPFAAKDTVVVDVTCKPENGTSGQNYLVRCNDGSACIASAWDGRYVIDLTAKKVLVQGTDYTDFQDAAIGKVVLHIRNVAE